MRTYQECRLEQRLVLLAVMTAVCSAADTPVSGHYVQRKQPLYVLVTGPFPDPHETVWDGGMSVILAVRLAFQQINQHPNILSEYTLELIEEDSGCSSVVKSKVFYSFVKSMYTYYNQQNESKGKRTVGIIGPSCSDPAIAIAPLLARPEVNLLQIAPTATSPVIELLNYNTTLTMMSSYLGLLGGLVELMKCNQWFEIGILQDEVGTPKLYKAIILKSIKEKVSSLSGYNISYSFPVYDSENRHLFPLLEVREKRIRVVFVITGPKLIQRLLCLAYHFNMTYPQYQWVFGEKQLSDFKTNITVKYDGNQYTCSDNVMATAANGSIFINHIIEANSSTMIAETGLNYSTYRELYTQLLYQYSQKPKLQAIPEKVVHRTNRDKDVIPWENAYYDAGWALGLALDQLAKEGYDLNRHIVEEPRFTQLLIDRLLNVSFNGTTGRVHFDRQTKNAHTRVLITQLLKHPAGELTEVPLATYEGHGNLKCPSKFGFIGHKFDRSLKQINVSVSVIIILLTFTLTIITALLHFTYIICHKHKSIKAASPNLTHFSFLGCYFFAVALITYTTQKSFLAVYNIDVIYPAMCNVAMWCLMLGSSLILGTVFVKIWRLYKLFRHFRNERPGILLSDKALMCFVMLFLLIDIVLCFVWTLTSPWTLVRTFTLEYPTLYILPSCTCRGIEYWIVCVAVYKGGIALLLVTVSVLNRKIQRKHFSHTKEVNTLIYSLTILGAIGFPLYFVLRDGLSIYLPYLATCTIYLLTVLLCSLLLFLPPVIPALKLKLLTF